jgi:hypothetical protein
MVTLAWLLELFGSVAVSVTGEVSETLLGGV